MNEIIDDIKNLDYINVPLFKKMIQNIDNNIKKSIEKSDFNKASKLKHFKFLLIKYINECKYINNNFYLKKILEKMKNLSIKIAEIIYNEKNDTLIDIYLPKFDNEYINLLLIFFYKFSKINSKIIALLATDYLKKLYYTIQNSSLDNIYSKVSLYDFIINNPNKKLEKFILNIKEKNYKEDLISYSIFLLYPLYKYNININIKDINKLKLYKFKTNNEIEKENKDNIDYKNLRLYEERLFNNNEDYDIYKNILKSFIENYPKFNLKNYKEYIREFIEKILNYNSNNINDILDSNMRFKYSITKKKIMMLIDINEENKTYIYDNLIKLVNKISDYDLNNSLNKYNIKLETETIIYIKLIILIFIIDILKNDKRELIEKKPNTFINYIKKTNKRNVLLYNLKNVINYIINHEKKNITIKILNSYNIKFILKKTIRNPLDLDPDGNLFNNNESYFNECLNLLKKFIIKVPNIYTGENYIKKLENFIDNLIMSEKNTLKKKIAVIETKDLEKIIKLNFSNNQNNIYDILLNNFFSNNDIIKYTLNNNESNNENINENINTKTINIYIYKSKHYIVNILIIFIIFIFKKNKLDICDNIKLLLNYLKNELIEKMNINKYYIGCENIKKNIKLETFCLNKYNLLYKDKLNLVKISSYLLDIIDNNKFKIIYNKKTDIFEFTVDYNVEIKKITEHLTNSQFLTGINEDLNSLIKKDINKIIINFLTRFIKELTNIFINIFTNSKFIFNILNIQINDSNKKNIFQYLNYKENSIYYTLNFKIRKLCVVIFIKVFIKYLLVQFKNQTEINNIFNDLINIIQDIICNKINIEYRYNYEKLFNDFINKYSFISTK